ncbi:MAG: gamma-glutamyltransferase [Alphaproteobacteria bacterium]
MPEGTLGHVQGFLGGVAADEPRAALLARNTLSAGGNAVDAAVVLYFTLSVTLPSSASLGGGGVCLVFDRAAKKVEALDFTGAAAGPGPGGAPESPVPGNARGMFALHAKYGNLRWEQLVSAAEKLARFGNPVSRALVRDIGSGQWFRDSASRRIFTGGKGGLVKEGEVIDQLDLAAVLSMMRRAPGDFYAGRFARRFVKSVRQAGGSLTAKRLRRFSPRWRTTVPVSFGNLTAHFPPTASGVTAAQLWAVLVARGFYRSADRDERGHVFAEAAMRAYADRGRWAGGRETLADMVSRSRVRRMMAGYDDDRHTPAASLNPAPAAYQDADAATSFVVADKDGSGVSCSFSLNSLFGTGRVVPGTGIFLAAPLTPQSWGAPEMSPMLVLNQNVFDLFFLGAASGGAAAPTSLIHVALQSLVQKKSLRDAMFSRRLHHAGNPDKVLFERGERPETLRELTRRGHVTAEVPALGRVNAFYCPQGFETPKSICYVRADPRGAGLSQRE